MSTDHYLLTLVSRFPKPQGALANVLHYLNAERPRQADTQIIEIAAKLCDLPVNTVSDIFLDSDAFRHIEKTVCVGILCMMAGAEEIYEKLETTGLTVGKASCLGLCNSAPVVRDAGGNMSQACASMDWIMLQRGQFSV